MKPEDMSMTLPTEIPRLDLSTGSLALSNNTTLRRLDANFSSYPCGLQSWQIPTYSSSTRVTFIALNCSMGLLIIMCNLLTISAVFKEQRLRVLSNIYIASLAVSDLLMGCLLILIGISFLPDCRFWLHGRKNYCVTVMFLLHVSVICSAIHMVLISLDRYVFLMKPLQYTRISEPLLRWSLAIAWGTSILYGLLVYVADQPGPVKSCVAYRVLHPAYSVYGISIAHFVLSLITAYVYGSLTWLSIKLQSTRPEHYKEARSGKDRASISTRFSRRASSLDSTYLGPRRWSRAKSRGSHNIDWLLFASGRKLQRTDTEQRTVPSLPSSEVHVVQQSPPGCGYPDDRSLCTSTSGAAGAIHLGVARARKRDASLQSEDVMPAASEDVHSRPSVRIQIRRITENDETELDAVGACELVAASADGLCADGLAAAISLNLSSSLATPMSSTPTAVGLASETRQESCLLSSDTSEGSSHVDASLVLSHRTSASNSNTEQATDNGLQTTVNNQQATDNGLQTTVNNQQATDNCNNERVTENDKQATENDQKTTDTNQQVMTNTHSVTDNIQQLMENEVTDYITTATSSSERSIVGRSGPSNEHSTEETSAFSPADAAESAGTRDRHTEDIREQFMHFNDSETDMASSVSPFRESASAPETAIPTTLANAQVSKRKVMDSLMSCPNLLTPDSQWKGSRLSFGSGRLSALSVKASFQFFMSNFHHRRSLGNPRRYWKSVRLFVYVFVSFVLFWMPYHVCLFLNLKVAVSANVMLATTFLGFFHSGFSFFIYAMTSKDFRKYFQRTLCPCFHRLEMRKADQHVTIISGMSTPSVHGLPFKFNYT